MPGGLGQSLLGLTSFLNQRIPDRRPATLEGATPVGRTPGNLGAPAAAGTTAPGGPGFGGGAVGSNPANQIPGALAGQNTDLSGAAGPAGPAGPGPGQTKQLEQQVTTLKGREGRVQARATRREGRVAARATKRETRLGGKATRLEQRGQSLTAAGKTVKGAKVKARAGKVAAKDVAVATKAAQTESNIAGRATAKVAKIGGKIAKKQAKIFG